MKLGASLLAIYLIFHFARVELAQMATLFAERPWARAYHMALVAVCSASFLTILEIAIWL